MANASIEILKPLKRSCAKIEAKQDVENSLRDVTKFASKGAFYQHHTFVELLAIVARKLSLPESTKAAIFKLLGTIVHDGNGNKDTLLCQIYSFLAQSKVSRYF
jgi:hypothetical protein